MPYIRGRRRRRRFGRGGIKWDIDPNQPKITDRTPSQIYAERYKKKASREQAIKEAAKKRAAEAAEREKRRNLRLIQLEKMPGGKGRKEAERIRKGGSLKETAAEKSKRQEKARLEGIRRSGGGLGGQARNVTEAIKSLARRKR